MVDGLDLKFHLAKEKAALASTGAAFSFVDGMSTDDPSKASPLILLRRQEEGGDLTSKVDQLSSHHGDGVAA